MAFWGGVVENARVVEANGERGGDGRRSAGASRLRMNVVAMVVVGCCRRDSSIGVAVVDARMETQLFGSRVAARDSDKRRQLSALADAWSHGSCCPVPASGPPPPVERHRRCTARSRRAGALGAVPRLKYTPAPVALHPLGRLVSCCSCRLSSVVPISGVFVPSPLSPTP